MTSLPYGVKDELYFTYGSNMFTPKLHKSAPSARFLCVAWLTGYRLAWHKRSKDGSGKCDMEKTLNSTDITHGVVFTMDQREWPALDKSEGPGYERVTIDVDSIGGPRRVGTYLARERTPGLSPHDWYREYVIRGARLNGLPENYIDALTLVLAGTDADADRARREWGFIMLVR